MARPISGRPSDMELAILKILWGRGPSTVREVWEAMLLERAVGYTSVLKIMQIMRQKKLVHCNTRGRPHVYRPRQSEQSTLRRLTGDLLQRAFDGSTRRLLMSALEHQRATPEELDEIRRLLDEWQQGLRETGSPPTPT